ncbi:hypothetical protein N9L68_04780 [bacterium]|nr:hypothetical protein [bacterium]
MCEVLAPPRVSTEAAKYGIEVGAAMDLTTGWGFTKEADRRRAEYYVDKEKPLVLIGSFPCEAFSQLQALIPESDSKAHQLAEGIKHMSSWRSSTGSRSTRAECFSMNSRHMRGRGRSHVSEIY